MKNILILLLFSTTAFSQCPEDFWSNAVLVHDTPLEIQVGPGVAYRSIVIERSDTTQTETWVITKKGAIPEPVITEKVDAEKATFTGAWVRGATPAPGWYEGTIAFSNQPGATASYTFTGRGIEIYAEHKRTHGSGVVTLSQGTNVIETKTVTFTGADALPVKVYEKTLPQGTYTVKLTVGNGYNLIDYFSVTK